MAENDKHKPQAVSAKSNDEMSEEEIDETLAETFPASDPPSWTLGTDHREESRDDKSDVADNKLPTSIEKPTH
jgi:hypothetical protein